MKGTKNLHTQDDWERVQNVEELQEEADRS